MTRALHVAPCDRKAAQFAVERWHYSHVMPSGKLMSFGVWEHSEFIGAVLFGRGANNNIASEYGLAQTEVCELVRVALRAHEAPVSQAVAQCLRQVRAHAPGVRLVVSYADPAQGHHGGIYQAGNWAFTGMTRPQRQRVVNGVLMHKRSVSARYGTASVSTLRAKGVDIDYAEKASKLKYAYPLDKAMRKQIAPLAKPYPTRQKHSDDASASQAEEGGSIPTLALHSSTVPPEA